MVPLVASNRIGEEPNEAATMTFYGGSFIADELGAKLVEASNDRQEVVLATVDLARIRARRASWGFFRDRRPDLYRPLLTLDGGTEVPGSR
jgi:N-carbamoylputrescine amidase